MNRYTTLLAGRHARAVFRNEARVIELAENLSERSQHPQLMLWVAWLVIMADGKITDDEALLIRHLVRLVRDQHQVVDEQLAHLVDVDPAEVWRRLDAEPGDLSDLLDAANRVATVDGAVNAPRKPHLRASRSVPPSLTPHALPPVTARSRTRESATVANLDSPIGLFGCSVCLSQSSPKARRPRRSAPRRAVIKQASRCWPPSGSAHYQPLSVHASPRSA